MGGSHWSEAQVDGEVAPPGSEDGNVTDCNVVGSDSSVAETDYSYTNSGDSDMRASVTGDGA